MLVPRASNSCAALTRSPLCAWVDRAMSHNRITLCDANQAQIRNANPRWSSQSGSYLLRSGSALAAPVEPDAGRAGQGTGTPRPPLCARSLSSGRPKAGPVGRRLQHLCAEPAGGRAGDGECRAVPDRTSQAEGQQGEERGGAPQRAQVPRLQLHQRDRPASSDCTAGPDPVRQPRAAADAAHQGPKLGADDRMSVRLSDGLARLLRLLPDRLGLARLGWVGTAAVAVACLGAMALRPAALPRTTGSACC